MIHNERQYRISKSEAQKFKIALEKFEAEPLLHLHPKLQKVQYDALYNQHLELLEDITEYETLVGSGKQLLNLQALLELPQALVQARIAAGLTQKELALRLGLKEQQVQRYEASGYQSANLERVLKVAQVLNQQSA